MERSGRHDQSHRRALEEFQGCSVLSALIAHVVCFVDGDRKE